MGAGVFVAVGVDVNVALGDGVKVGVNVELAVGVGVRVDVSVGVGVAVCVGIDVSVGVGVDEGVGVDDATPKTICRSAMSVASRYSFTLKSWVPGGHEAGILTARATLLSSTVPIEMKSPIPGPSQ